MIASLLFWSREGILTWWRMQTPSERFPEHMTVLTFISDLKCVLHTLTFTSRGERTLSLRVETLFHDDRTADSTLSMSDVIRSQMTSAQLIQTFNLCNLPTTDCRSAEWRSTLGLLFWSSLCWRFVSLSTVSAACLTSRLPPVLSVVRESTSILWSRSSELVHKASDPCFVGSVVPKSRHTLWLETTAPRSADNNMRAQCCDTLAMGCDTWHDWDVRAFRVAQVPIPPPPMDIPPPSAPIPWVGSCLLSKPWSVTFRSLLGLTVTWIPNFRTSRPTCSHPYALSPSLCRTARTSNILVSGSRSTNTLESRPRPYREGRRGQNVSRTSPALLWISPWTSGASPFRVM